MLFNLDHVYDALLSWDLVINAVIPPFTVALLVLKQQFGGVELESVKGLCCAMLTIRKSSALLVFFLGTAVGPVYTFLVLVMFPVFRHYGKGTNSPMLCIELPAHLAALDFCHLGHRCFKALHATYTTVFTQQLIACTKWEYTCCPK